MSGECPMCGTIGGGGFFREPTNLGDQPNGMQLIPCPQCGGVREHKLRMLANRIADPSLYVWTFLFLALMVLRATGIISTSWWIVIFPLWGSIVFWTIGPFVLRILAKVLYALLWLIT